MKFLIFLVIAVCFAIVLRLFWMSIKLLKDTQNKSKTDKSPDHQSDR